MRPYKMQIRTFLRDGVPTYQTVATKGKEVIPFLYNGDIIYLGLGSKHPQHDRDFGIVQQCLNASHGLGYSYAGIDLVWELENAMESFCYKRDEFITRDIEDFSIEYPTIFSTKIVKGFYNQQRWSKVNRVSNFFPNEHLANREA